MSNRLSKIYTKTGDSGTTGLADGSRIDKDDYQVEAMGDLDELNSSIGLLLSEGVNHQAIKECLTKVQHLLFDLGGEIAMPAYQAIKPEHILELETLIDDLNQELPPLKEFILPRGDKSTCHIHLARSICRRAERRLVTLHKQRPLNEQSMKFINRLSDLLFVSARMLAKLHLEQEILWNHEKAKKS